MTIVWVCLCAVCLCVSRLFLIESETESSLVRMGSRVTQEKISKTYRNRDELELDGFPAAWRSHLCCAASVTVLPNKEAWLICVYSTKLILDPFQKRRNCPTLPNVSEPRPADRPKIFPGVGNHVLFRSLRKRQATTRRSKRRRKKKGRQTEKKKFGGCWILPLDWTT